MPDHYRVTRAEFRLYKETNEKLHLCGEGQNTLSGKKGVCVTVGIPKKLQLAGTPQWCAPIIAPLSVKSGNGSVHLHLLGKMIICEPGVKSQLIQQGWTEPRLII